MWNKLLIPHDFSSCADGAMRTAAELAKVHGSELTLVHVSELPAEVPGETLVTPAGGSAPVRLDLFIQRGAQRELERRAEPLRGEGVAVRTLALTGNVVDEILTLAAELGAEALIVGTHGRRGLSHLLLGSVAEKLVRRAPIPVVTVRVPAPEVGATREERAAEGELAG